MNQRRSPWRAWVAALALIAMGAALGITMDRLHHSSDDRFAALAARVHHDPVGVMERELKLRPEQRLRVAAILETRQANIDQVWEETHNRLQATIDSVMNEIAAVLDSNQAAQFRSLANELHKPGRMHRLRSE